MGVTIWGCQWHLERTVQALVGCAGLGYVLCNINSFITCDVFAVFAVLWLLGYQSVCLLVGMVYRVVAGIGSQKRFRAALALTICKTSSSTPTWHECMELVFKLSYQVQQLELYVVNYAYFLLCSAQGKMSKKCKGWLSLGGCSVQRAPLMDGLAQQRAGL